MKITITDITAKQVVQICTRLSCDGYRHGEDFEPLYGKGWALVGVQFTGHPVVIQRAVNVAQEVAEATKEFNAKKEFTLPKFGHDYIR